MIKLLMGAALAVLALSPVGASVTSKATLLMRQMMPVAAPATQPTDNIAIERYIAEERRRLESLYAEYRSYEEVERCRADYAKLERFLRDTGRNMSISVECGPRQTAARSLPGTN